MAAFFAAAPMTPQERKVEFHGIASLLMAQGKVLERLAAELALDCDKRAVRHMVRDLDSAVENCLVVGHHQLGEKLDDEMGYGGPWPPMPRPPRSNG